MPFGMKNSPATFQRLINSLIAGMDGIGAYIDDVIIYSDFWENHVGTIKEFFDRVSIAPDKAAYCVFKQLLGPKNAIKLISVRTKTQ